MVTKRAPAAFIARPLADARGAGVKPIRAAALNPRLGGSQLFANGVEIGIERRIIVRLQLRVLGTAAPAAVSGEAAGEGLGAGGLRATV